MRIGLQKLGYRGGALRQRAGRVRNDAEVRIGHLRIESRLEAEELVRILVGSTVDGETLRVRAGIRGLNRELPGQHDLEGLRVLLIQAVQKLGQEIIQRADTRSDVLSDCGEESRRGPRWLDKTARKRISQAIE
jgi:hypothetical protein